MSNITSRHYGKSLSPSHKSLNKAHASWLSHYCLTVLISCELSTDCIDNLLHIGVTIYYWYNYFCTDSLDIPLITGNHSPFNEMKFDIAIYLQITKESTHTLHCWSSDTHNGHCCKALCKKKKKKYKALNILVYINSEYTYVWLILSWLTDEGCKLQLQFMTIRSNSVLCLFFVLSQFNNWITLYHII